MEAGAGSRFRAKHMEGTTTTSNSSRIISNGSNNNSNDETKKASSSGWVNDIAVPAAGMFFFYVCHDALQEEMFRTDGFEFAWFMSLAEASTMLLCSALFEGVSILRPAAQNHHHHHHHQKKMAKKANDAHTMFVALAIGLFVAASHGLGNSALLYCSYPLKVAFKSCKLIPTMFVNVLINGTKHSSLEYTAAVLMCMGLFGMSIADTFSFHSSNTTNINNITSDAVFSIGAHLIGPILLTMAISFESVVPNLQDRLLRRSKLSTADMIFMSNSSMVFILLCITISSGEFFHALHFCRTASQKQLSLPISINLILLLQCLCAYFGLRCYLTVVRSHGGVAGVLVANARKIVTIALSFILFSKPFRLLHAIGLLLVFCGVYIGVILRKHRAHGQQKKTEEDDDDDEERQQQQQQQLQLPASNTKQKYDQSQQMIDSGCSDHRIIKQTSNYSPIVVKLPMG